MDFGRFGSASASDIAIDLGTANTLVYLPGQGVIIDEPSVVAVEQLNGVQRITAIGSDAKMLIGKTPDYIKTYRPLTDGVIGDLEMAEEMIKHFIRKATGTPSLLSRGPEIVICVPSGATTVERRAIRAAALNAGGREVWLVEEPMAAAIGAGLPVDEPVGSMIVDIGGGTTEVGIITLSRLVFGTSGRVGGDHMDEAISSYMRRKHRLVIGSASAERIKLEIGSALATAESHLVVGRVSGQDLGHGGPREISVSQAEIVDALRETIGQIVQLVRSALENTKPEIAADIIDEGIVMTGGGSLLRNLDIVLADETSLPVTVADAPLRCVAIGAGRVLEDRENRELFCPA
jgi:rod shape-determining protein MreB